MTWVHFNATPLNDTVFQGMGFLCNCKAKLDVEGGTISPKFERIDMSFGRNPPSMKIHLSFMSGLAFKRPAMWRSLCVLENPSKLDFVSYGCILCRSIVQASKLD